MRSMLLAVAAVAAALLVPSVAAAQSIQVINNTTDALTLKVNLFNTADMPGWPPCSAITIGSAGGAFDKSGFCGSFSELKMGIEIVRAGGTASARPDCYLFNIYWNGRVTITGSETGLSCTRVN